MADLDKANFYNINGWPLTKTVQGKFNEYQTESLTRQPITGVESAALAVPPAKTQLKSKTHTNKVKQLRGQNREALENQN